MKTHYLSNFDKLTCYKFFLIGKIGLTCSNSLAIAEPLDLHGGVADGGNLGVEVNLFALDDVQVPQRGQEARSRVPGGLLDLSALLLGAALHVLQVDHLGLVLLSREPKMRVNI